MLRKNKWTPEEQEEMVKACVPGGEEGFRSLVEIGRKMDKWRKEKLVESLTKLNCRGCKPVTAEMLKPYLQLLGRRDGISF